MSGGLTLPLPTFHQIDAKPYWRCIDFLSDIHLHASAPHTVAALECHLLQTNADAVFILGDLFEAWVGDDVRSQDFEARCLSFLKSTSQRLDLAVMVGNRDFLMGQSMMDACGATGIDDPSVLSAFGQRILLTHGDSLCLDDHEYLRFRAMVRQKAWQDAFLTKPLSERLAIAKQMREASASHQMNSGEEWADVDSSEAGRWLDASEALTLIHGHTHHPKSEPFGIPGAVRHVLSDWEFDKAKSRGDVLRLTAQGITRLNLTT